MKHWLLVVTFAASAGCKSPDGIGPDDAGTAVADTFKVIPAPGVAVDAAGDALPDAVGTCRDAGATRVIANRSWVVLTGKLRKRIMKPAAGSDSGHWHDVFVLDLEDPPCIADEGGVAVYRTAQVDAVWQGTGPKACWRRAVGQGRGDDTTSPLLAANLATRRLQARRTDNSHPGLDEYAFGQRWCVLSLA